MTGREVASTARSSCSGGGKEKGPFGPDGLRHPPPDDRITMKIGRMLAIVKRFCMLNPCGRMRAPLFCFSAFLNLAEGRELFWGN